VRKLGRGISPNRAVRPVSFVVRRRGFGGGARTAPLTSSPGQRLHDDRAERGETVPVGVCGRDNRRYLTMVSVRNVSQFATSDA